MNAYKEGKEAYNEFVGLQDYPYPFKTDEREDWVSGWYDAREEHTDIIYGD